MSFPLINVSQFFDSSGAPLAAGTVEFRSPTTNAYINTYPTADKADSQSDPNDNPLTLNARGEAPTGIYLEDGVKYRIILKDSEGAQIWDQDDVRCPQYITANYINSLFNKSIKSDTKSLSLSGKSITVANTTALYVRNATIVEDRTLLASASATATNNNNVLAALIADLKASGIIQ